MSSTIPYIKSDSKQLFILKCSQDSFASITKNFKTWPDEESQAFDTRVLHSRWVLRWDSTVILPSEIFYNADSEGKKAKTEQPPKLFFTKKA